jgi:FAD/FMN-containing dehydrogenase
MGERATRTRAKKSIVERLRMAAGPGGEADAERAKTDRHLGLTGECLIALAPSTVEQIAAVISLCHREDLAVVPQGGRTGLVGGALATADSAVAISLERLNRIRDVDPGSFTATVDAGVVLADLQHHLGPLDLRLPLDLGSAESCQIGGLVATNAGGIGALRFGSMRELVLGLEVVLPDGRIWNGLRQVRKDNSGYDLKSCFIGSEGTLGVITGAVLKLSPIPRSRATALIGLRHRDDLIPLFVSARNALSEFVSAFELVSAIGFDHALVVDTALQRPFDRRFEDYVMIELESAIDLDLDAHLQNWLERQADVGRILDAALAQNLTQRAAFWRIRELAPWGGGESIQFDISVPLTCIPAFLAQADRSVRTVSPGAGLNAFGHVGDGNIHYHICPPAGLPDAAFAALRPRFSDAVHDAATRLGGSFSAEHGIGLARKAELRRYKDALELGLMRDLKTALDPRGTMNPSKIFD